ncbi:3-oxoacyl-[acyl-carrier-protein] reductase [Candidatus Bandiella euplotis]|uniref:3-oxoacyl-[acyl-carrier-protein] reductase n=1 Tax=Candidatus Bandiella euplotis TaxID=1664265 RepID=A0ABZ0UNN2_9RICK|nr:3-oxoacyl-[acyl-carrier-protein] reductase [Candidatus Bandiella woodruffii]WPX97142.1 3-oxoacyl-[acyl-carrier-protein] reductase FabG [Candidatus Bandiella woodruffii]
MFKLQNKLALVTGATGGIGQAIVKTLCAQGAKVAAIGRNQESLQNLQKELGDSLHPMVCDFTDELQLSSLIEGVEKEFGALDILVCNAGVTKDSLAIRLKNEDWDRVINLNLTTTFKLNREAIKSMLKRKYGKIVNISSVIGLTGNAGQSNYAASKAGMIGMTKSLALEVAARGITLNCVAPGYIDTPMTQVLSEEIKTSIINHIPIRRIGTPQDIANAVLFLAADESSYITGHTLSVNGGMFMS